MNDIAKKMQHAQDYARNNLSQCVQELIDWDEQGVLEQDGYIHNLKILVTDAIGETNSIMVSRNMVETALMNWYKENVIDIG